jgi:hypothetical protein
MRRNRRTLEKIQRAFADAVAAGEFEKAEGWLAVARWRTRTLSWPSAPPFQRAEIVRTSTNAHPR